MRHRTKGKILDRKKGPREALLTSLAISVILYEKIKTTRAKAAAVRPLVERIITAGRDGSLTARRRINATLRGNDLAGRKVMDVIGPRYKDRNGGYTRVTKLLRRPGDGAEMVQLELV